MRPSAALAALAVAAALALAALPARAQEAYDAGMARARELSAGGDARAAAEVLAGVVRAYPQDYAARLELAWALYRSGSLREAEAAYRAASALNPDAEEARLGIAWCALGLGDAPRARRLFEEALARDPTSRSARDGLARLGPASRAVGVAFGVLELWSGDPVLDAAYGVVAGFDATVADRLALSVRYRGLGASRTVAASTTRMGRMQGGTSLADEVQHEGHLAAGWRTARWEALGHGALLTASGSEGRVVWREDAALLGASARLSVGADLRASLTRTFRADEDVDQLEATVGVPLGPRVAILGGIRAQRTAGERFAAGLGEVELHGPGWALAAGGAGGRQHRPVVLAAYAISNRDADLVWAGWARARRRLGRVTGLGALELEGWVTPLATGGEKASRAVRLSLGIAF